MDGQYITNCCQRVVSHYNDAVAHYNAGNTSNAMQSLGKALHYIQDLSETHHTNSLTAVNSNHSDFENYVDVNRSNFGTDVIATLNLSDKYYSRTVNGLAIDCAWESWAYGTSCQNTSMYDTVAAATIDIGRKYSVYLFYFFLKDTGLV